jgi:hypothetical protein
LAEGDPDIVAYIAETAVVVSRLAKTLAESVLDYSIAAPLIQEAQALLRERLQCCSPLVNQVVGVSVAAGAYAAKQVGERGRHVFALCPQSRVSEVLKALKALPVQMRETTIDNLGLYIDH